MQSAKQGGIGSHFYSLWYNPAGDWTLEFQVSGQTLYHKATELVHLNKYLLKEYRYEDVVFSRKDAAEQLNTARQQHNEQPKISHTDTNYN